MPARASSEWLSQVRRGLLELCVLALVGAETSYGYEIVTHLSTTRGLAAGEGTVYPLLRRLRRDGLLSTSWQESDAGPPRQYYALTPEGHTHLDALRREWTEIVASVESTLTQETSHV